MIGTMNKFKYQAEHNRDLYLSLVEPFEDMDLIKVIVGMRRSGKSILLRQIINRLMQRKHIPEDKILFIDKESLEFAFIRNHMDLYQYVKEREPYYLFIDEVQEIENWEKAIASFHKERMNVYITGSNANLLASDLATYLTGRYVTIRIFTLSFLEFMQFYKHENWNIKEGFVEYLQRGGLPVLSQFKGDEMDRRKLVQDLLETIILKDVVAKNNIRRIKTLDNVIHFVIDNIGNTFSANKVSQYLKSQQIDLDAGTVHNYLKYLTATFALHMVKRYDIRGKRHLEISEKYYLGDLGFRHALLGYRKEDINAFLENIVYLELLRRRLDVYIGKWDEYEIDFVVESAGERQYIQVCTTILDPDVLKREVRPLQLIKDNHPKMIFTLDDVKRSAPIDGVRLVNLVEWLQEEKRV